MCAGGLRTGRATVVALAGLTAITALQAQEPSASIVQSFDGHEGTGYLLTQHLDRPGPVVRWDGAGGSLLHLTDSGCGDPQFDGCYPGYRNELNSIVFDHVAPGAYSTVVADFDFRLAAPHYRNRSDGFSFTLLSTARFGTQGSPPAFYGEEPSLPRCLGIGFDIYANRGSWYLPEFPEVMHYFTDPDNNHVSVHFDGELVAQFPIDPAVLDLASGEFSHAHLELVRRATGTHATLVITSAGGGSVTPFGELLIPGMAPYDARVLFSARLGNAGADQDLDNVRVLFLDPVPASEDPEEPGPSEVSIASQLVGSDTLFAGQTVEVPVRLDLSGSGAVLGAFTAFAVWDASLLSYQGTSPGTFGQTVYADAETRHNDVGNEFVNFSGFDLNGADGPVDLARLVFRVIGGPGQTGWLEVSFPELYSTEATAFRDLSPHVATVRRSFTVCASRRLGDADGDGRLTIRDAQLVAAWTVSGVRDPADGARIAKNGDMDGDTQVTIRDALMIAAEAARTLGEGPADGDPGRDVTVVRLQPQAPGTVVRLVFPMGPQDAAYQLALAWDGDQMALSAVQAASAETLAGDGSLQLTALGMAGARPVCVDFVVLDGATGASVRCQGQAVSTDFTTHALFPQVDGSMWTAVAGGGPQAAVTHLASSYPNPFNHETVIPYVLGEAGLVVLTVYDLQGQRVCELVRQQQTAGEHRVNWDGRDGMGRPAGSGVYVYRLEAGPYTQVRKTTLIR